MFETDFFLLLLSIQSPCQNAVNHFTYWWHEIKGAFKLSKYLQICVAFLTYSAFVKGLFQYGIRVLSGPCFALCSRGILSDTQSTVILHTLLVTENREMPWMFLRNFYTCLTSWQDLSLLFLMYPNKVAWLQPGYPNRWVSVT